MKIEKIISQHRRDFIADYKCEACGDISRGNGYDDYNFHHNVIPKMTCQKCGAGMSDDYRPLTTLYPEGFQV